MGKLSWVSAILALTSSAVLAAPTPAEAVVAGGVWEGDGNVTTTYRSKEEAQALARMVKRDAHAAPVAQVESRQDWFGQYWQDFNFQGPSLGIRPPIDNQGHFIGTDWNDRISSIWNYSPDKKCVYWTEWDGYCYGSGLILAGRVSYSVLGSDFNDKISCLECSWN